MSTVLAKFKLNNVEDTKYAVPGSATLQLMGVQGEPFGPATPYANLSMVIQNPAAAAIFREPYQKYVAEAEAWTLADKTTRGEYPKSPEFYVTFKLDDGTGAE